MYWLYTAWLVPFLDETAGASLSQSKDLWMASIDDSSTTTTTTTTKIDQEKNDCNNQTDSHQNDEHEKPITFVKLGLQDSDDIVLEVKAAVMAQSEILETHQIKCAHHITVDNPKYK